MRKALLVLLGVVGALFALFAALVVLTVFDVLPRSSDVGPLEGEHGGADDLPVPAAEVPTDRILFSSDRTGTFEIFSMDLDGGDVRQLTDDDRYDTWWPRISPDRRHVLFHRSPPGVHDTDFEPVSLWVMAADGSGATELRPAGADGWEQQGHAEWSPDGTEIVLFGGSSWNPQIFVVSATGGLLRQVTDRGGTNIDPSFHPDGDRIAFVGCPRTVCFPRDYEIYVVAADGSGEAERITDSGMRDHDPYYSPDGRYLAWLTETDPGGEPVPAWDIFIANADGSDQRQLTDDAHINSKPEWSHDGELIYFHRLEPGVHDGFSIFEIRPDGTGMRELTDGQPGVNEFPSN